MKNLGWFFMALQNKSKLLTEAHKTPVNWPISNLVTITTPSPPYTLTTTIFTTCLPFKRLSLQMTSSKDKGPFVLV